MPISLRHLEGSPLSAAAVDRSTASMANNETFRQIIPYVVLQVDGKIISYLRTPAGTDQRLHGRRSIGFGGHVELCDLVVKNGTIDLIATLENAALREVHEEIGALHVVHRSWRGILVDNRTSVGRVHIGIASYWQLDRAPRISHEATIGDVQLNPANAISSMALEHWSALVLSDLRSINKSPIGKREPEKRIRRHEYVC